MIASAGERDLSEFSKEKRISTTILLSQATQPRIIGGLAKKSGSYREGGRDRRTSRNVLDPLLLLEGNGRVVIRQSPAGLDADERIPIAPEG